MNNPEKRREAVSEPSPALKPADAKHCYQCDGQFGLIRHRANRKQFCSKRCVEKYRAGTELKMPLIREWRDYFTRKR
jgi:hypothetical protein